MKKQLFLCLSLLAVALLSGYPLQAQVDSVVFNNGNYITGAVESMNQGILVVSTDYSDDDFTIEWEKVSYLETGTIFMVTIVSMGEAFEYLASLKTSAPGRLQVIMQDGGEPVDVSVDDIVNLNPISDKFMDRLSANIDVGYSQAKANDLVQFNVGAGISYEAPKWTTEISYNSLMSDQDEVEETRRNEAALSVVYKLPRLFFGIAKVNMLSNTELDLDLRTNAQLGAGAFLLRSNHAYWSFQGGANYNVERFTDPVLNPDNESWEGFFGTDANIYDLGDLNFRYLATFYPGITEQGRWRSDMSLSVTYDFPHDFYITGGFSLNWDNQPAAGTDPLDWVYNVGFGWEW